MFKALLIVILLLIACGYALLLLRRLGDTVQQLGKLREDLARSDANLNDQLQTIQERQAAPDATQNVTQKAAQESQSSTQFDVQAADDKLKT